MATPTDPLETLRTEYQSALTTLQNELQTLRNELSELRASQHLPRPRQQLPEPAKFDGKPHHLRTWLPTIKAKIRVDGDAMGDPVARFYYVYGNLETTVQAMVLPQLAEAETQGVWDYNTILDQLARVFENPNQQQEAEDALHNIRQADKESLPSYIAKFERLVYEAGAQAWPDSIKISTLRNGLNLSTRRALSTQLSIPASYNAFLQMIQRLSRRQVTFQHDHATPVNHYTDKMDVSAVTAKAGVMEVGTLGAFDFIDRAPAEPQQAPSASTGQRDQWRRVGLCVRCGSAAHWVANCPQRPTVSKSKSKAEVKALYQPSICSTDSNEDLKGLL